MPSSPDDDTLTLRVPRVVVALLLAVVVHMVVGGVLSQVNPPPPPPKRVAITIRPPPPPPRATSPTTSAPPPKSSRRTSERPRQTSPVAPVLPASEQAPENRAQLPDVEVDPAPAPPPTPSWRTMLQDALAQSTPGTTTLGPKASTLARIANADARLHDDDNERRLQTDFGPFFRRGIEALRPRWHPDEVLGDRQDPQTRRCAQQTRTTLAVAIIDRSGNVIDVELKSSSGCPSLDDEAIAAFRKVAQFPNPPEGLFVDGEGTPTKTARYPVRFIVTFDGRIRLDWQG
jgi:TonB family protein